MEKLHGIKTGTVDSFTLSGKRVRWIPKGPLIRVGGNSDLPSEVAANPSAQQAADEFLSGKPIKFRETARLFVGFNVGDKPVWRTGQVYLLAYILRDRQIKKSGKGAPAFTLYLGVGAFPGGAVVASEHSAQLVFINFSQKGDAFIREMFELAQMLAENLHQESVLIEVQRQGGISQYEYIEANQQFWVPVSETKKFLNENKDLVLDEYWRMK